MKSTPSHTRTLPAGNGPEAPSYFLLSTDEFCSLGQDTSEGHNFPAKGSPLTSSGSRTSRGGQDWTVSLSLGKSFPCPSSVWAHLPCVFSHGDGPQLCSPCVICRGPRAESRRQGLQPPVASREQEQEGLDRANWATGAPGAPSPAPAHPWPAACLAGKDAQACGGAGSRCLWTGALAPPPGLAGAVSLLLSGIWLHITPWSFGALPQASFLPGGSVALGPQGWLCAVSPFPFPQRGVGLRVSLRRWQDAGT